MDTVYVVVLEVHHNTGSWADVPWSNFELVKTFHNKNAAVEFIESNAIAKDYYGHEVDKPFKWDDGDYVCIVPSSDKYPEQDFEEYVYRIIEQKVV